LENQNPNILKEVLEREITSGEQGKYIDVTFLMPKNIERVTVKIKVEALENQENVIDLGVRDPYRVRGWSGGARREFFISEERATPGYLSGELWEGKWSVLLGAYKVGENGCRVRVEIELYEKHYRWLCGDLHLHSNHSDGSYSIEENIAYANEKGLDFIALTDHNTASQNLERPKNTKLTLIPGVELTTNLGHLNFLGVDDAVKDFRVNSDEELERKVAEARSHNATIVLNHPYCSFTGWRWDWNFDYDLVEVWNGPWREDNKKALDWWHEELVNGKKLISIGGSDTHKIEKYRKHGMPTTWVYSDSNSVSDILSNIHKGRVVITYQKNAPFITIKCGDKMMGDVCNHSNEDTNLMFSSLKEKDIIKVYSDKGLVLEEENEGETIKEYQIKNNNKKFLRAEVWRYIEPFKEPVLVSLSNPIFYSS